MTAPHVEPWVQTHAGHAFDLLTPRVEDVRVEEIATSLSRLSRYNGHTLGDADGYYVAQHCLLVADLLKLWGADAALQREGLLHDAGEAYYGDLTSPVQRALRVLGGGEALDKMKAGVDIVVRTALRLSPDEPSLVKRADLVALAIERRHLMAPCERDWKLPELADTRWGGLELLTSWEARMEFMRRLQVLDGSIPARAA
jgi:5'-deoxynucleotidase YfbR-like HD superfamily hydrolase